MITAGVDVGAVSAKAVILNSSRMVGTCILPTGHDIARVSRQVAESALRIAGMGMSDVDYTIATGYGRKATPFADKAVTEITCHAVGANLVVPAARTVIDIGGQDSKAIRVGEDGRVGEFVMNDKCAAGTGRFLEVMARALGLSIEEFAEMSMRSQDPCKISSICTVFAESEVVGLRAEKRAREDIIAGIHKAAISRVAAMTRGVGVEETIVFTGGVAKNSAMVKALEEEIGCRVVVPEDPQIIGALGAAWLAMQTMEGL